MKLLPVFLVLGVIVLAFFGAVFVVCRSWGKVKPWKRIAGPLLLAPHFLFLACFAVSLLYGHPPQGSPGFNTQFICAVLIVFILPVPALVGTVSAVVMFTHVRPGS